MDTRKAASLRVFFCVSAVVFAKFSAQSLYHAAVSICKRKVLKFRKYIQKIDFCVLERMELDFSPPR